MGDGGSGSGGNGGGASNANRLAAYGANAVSGNTLNLRYNHPLEWTASYDSSSRGVTVTRPSGSSLYFRAEAQSDVAPPVGISRKSDYRVQLLNADLTPNTQGDPAYMDMVMPNGMALRFSVETGKVILLRFSNGNEVTAEKYGEKLQVCRNSISGDIESIWCATQGLMVVIRHGDDDLRLLHYALKDVTKNADGSYTASGEPLKTYTYNRKRGDNGYSVTTITNQRRNQEAYVIERRVKEGTVSIIKGEGENRIVRTIESNYSRYDGREYTIETIAGVGYSTSTRTDRHYTPGGWLVTGQVEAYGSGLDRRTGYVYDDLYRVIMVSKSDGTYTRYEHDNDGRVTLSASPWAGGGERAVVIDYANYRFYDNRPSRVREVIISEEGEETLLSQTLYTYNDGDLVLSVSTEKTALGSSNVQRTYRETWGPQAPNPYSRGRAKMTRDVKGVETLYDYENTGQYGALYKVIRTTTVNGDLISINSRQTVQYIREDGNIACEEQYVNTSNMGMKLISREVHTYDDYQQCVKTERANGRVRTTDWMCCGPLRETDEDGFITNYGYNSVRHLIETIRSETETRPETIVTYTRNPNGQQLSARTDTGAMKTESFTAYDELGRPISSIDILNRTTTYSYSVDGLTTTTTTPTGATLVEIRYPDGSLREQSGTGQRNRRYEYHLTEEGIRTDGYVKAGDEWKLASRDIVNGFGETIRKELPTSNPGVMLVTTQDYNAKGQLVRTQTGDLAPTLYEYDDMGRMSRQIIALNENPTPLNSRIAEYGESYVLKEDGVYRKNDTVTYNEQGGTISKIRYELLSELDSVLERKTILVDARGNESVTWGEYNGATKRLNKATHPGVSTTAVSEIIDGEIVKETNHVGLVTTYARAWLADGIRLSVTDARNNTTIVKYDVAGKPVRQTDAAGNLTTTQYDDATGQPSVITNAQGKTTCYRYDERGRKIAEYGTGSQPLLFGYDEAGNMSKLITFRIGFIPFTTDPTGRTDGDVTAWLYDEVTGLLLRKTFADESQISYTYDAHNRLQTTTQARGVISTSTYAPLTGQLISFTHSDGTPGYHYAYNHIGQITSATDETGVRGIEYNSYGEPQTETTTGLIASELLRARDEYGRPAGHCLDMPGDHRLTSKIAYDSFGRIEGTSALGAGEYERLDFEYRYNSTAGYLEELVYPNGCVRTNTPNEHLNLLEIIAYENASCHYGVERIEYAHDSQQRVRLKTTGTSVWNYDYNDRSELSSVGRMDSCSGSCEGYYYSYDNIGNRYNSSSLQDLTTYATNTLNHYLDIRKNSASFAPQYDADGNQTLIKTSKGVWQVSYNANNRPVAFEQGNTRIECKYDCMGRRIGKTVYENDIMVSCLVFVYDGYLQIAEFNAMGDVPSLERRYLWDPTEPVATRPLVMIKGAWDYYCYIHDAMKNVINVTDQYCGTWNSYEYSPFGETREGHNQFANPFRFSSEYHDDDLGLIYYNYRHYNPTDGRWINRDPIAERGGWNLYGFVRNRPISVFDYLGLSDEGSVSGSISIKTAACKEGNNGNITMVPGGDVSIDLSNGNIKTSSPTAVLGVPESFNVSGSVEIGGKTIEVSGTLKNNGDVGFSAGVNKFTLFEIAGFEVEASGSFEQNNGDNKCNAKIGINANDLLKNLKLEGGINSTWLNGGSQGAYAIPGTISYNYKPLDNMSISLLMSNPDFKKDPKKNSCELSFGLEEKLFNVIKATAKFKVRKDTFGGGGPPVAGIEGAFHYNTGGDGSGFSVSITYTYDFNHNNLTGRIGASWVW